MILVNISQSHTLGMSCSCTLPIQTYTIYTQHCFVLLHDVQCGLCCTDALCYPVLGTPRLVRAIDHLHVSHFAKLMS